MSSSDHNKIYWDDICDEYQTVTRISCNDFHYGPLLPGDAVFQLLPADLSGKRCLEIGCGGAQNSIYLAKQGADCTAVDVSDLQLAHAAGLAEKEGVSIHLIESAMESLPADLDGFDLIHSVYGLPFSDCPKEVLCQLSQRLVSGGHLIVTVGHPLYAGEWVNLDDEDGLFLADYFNLPSDVRCCLNEEIEVASHFWQISEWVSWLIDAGFELTSLLEPQPLPVDTMTNEEVDAQMPYFSKDWLDLYSVLKHVPVVVILAATKKLDN